ncbi:MAG TPA: hypothetical protein VHV74_17705 [Pseudonocardiaceae bacterium]|nr:hypothetical protein [Pseudonocardiaceae bacterium]
MSPEEAVAALLAAWRAEIESVPQPPMPLLLAALAALTRARPIR